MSKNFKTGDEVYFVITENARPAKFLIDKGKLTSIHLSSDAPTHYTVQSFGINEYSYQTEHVATSKNKAKKLITRTIITQTKQRIKKANKQMQAELSNIAFSQNISNEQPKTAQE